MSVDDIKYIFIIITIVHINEKYLLGFYRLLPRDTAVTLFEMSVKRKALQNISN